MQEDKLRAFATDYAQAWSSQKASSVAGHFAPDGSLNINGGPRSVGRAAITVDAQGFMTAFPDMVVTMDSVRADGDRAVFHWTLAGTNTGPNGSGKAVRIRGYEEWTMSSDGLIQKSLGHYDQAELDRQLAR
ncbi:MAG: SgcJ/EcaC family oxidoreductase [Gemmatimonadaceae bacterium]